MHLSRKQQIARDPSAKGNTHQFIVCMRYYTIYTKINARAHKHASTIFFPVGTIQTDQEIVRIMRRTGFFPASDCFRGFRTAKELTSQWHLRFRSSAERLRSTKYQAHGAEPRRLKNIEKHDLEPKPSTVYISSLQLYSL